jgi:hypothetical protein
MSGHRMKFQKITTWSVIPGVVLLCGVMSMTYGYYHNSEVALYAGLAVTMVGAFSGILFLVFQPREGRLPRRKRVGSGTPSELEGGTPSQVEGGIPSQRQV